MTQSSKTAGTGRERLWRPICTKLRMPTKRDGDANGDVLWANERYWHVKAWDYHATASDTLYWMHLPPVPKDSYRNELSTLTR